MINNNLAETFWQLRCPPAVADAESASVRTGVAPSQLTTMTCNLTPTELRTCANGTVPRRGALSFAGCARERNKCNDGRLFFVRCCGVAESQQRELHVGTLYFTHSVCYMLDVMIRFMGMSLCETTSLDGFLVCAGGVAGVLNGLSILHDASYVLILLWLPRLYGAWCWYSHYE